MPQRRRPTRRPAAAASRRAPRRQPHQLGPGRADRPDARPRRRPLLLPEPGDRLRQDLHGDDRGQSPTPRAAARKQAPSPQSPDGGRPARGRKPGPLPGDDRRRRDPVRAPRAQLTRRGPRWLAPAPTSWARPNSPPSSSPSASPPSASASASSELAGRPGSAGRGGDGRRPADLALRGPRHLRAVLRRDPRSGFASSRGDRALEDPRTRWVAAGWGGLRRTEAAEGKTQTLAAISLCPEQRAVQGGPPPRRQDPPAGAPWPS